MDSNARRVSFAVLALLLMAGSSRAGLLPTDPNAIPGWSGFAPFTGTTAGVTLHAEVDFAVYAPANASALNFDNSAALGSPAAYDPSGGTQYVYAFEIINTGALTDATVHNLVVGLANSLVIPTANITNDPATTDGGIAPNVAQYVSGSSPGVKWIYTSSFPAGGQNSDILIFTSPRGPQMISSSILGGGTTVASANLPSPTPEPSSIVLSGIIAVCLAVGALIRRRRR